MYTKHKYLENLRTNQTKNPFFFFIRNKYNRAIIKQTNVYVENV